MAFDFDNAFAGALDAGLDAARPGGRAARDWLRESAAANEATLRAIAEGLAAGSLSAASAELLLQESWRAMRSEAATLGLISKASAQAAANAFAHSLSTALAGLLKGLA